MVERVTGLDEESALHAFHGLCRKFAERMGIEEVDDLDGLVGVFLAGVITGKAVAVVEADDVRLSERVASCRREIPTAVSATGGDGWRQTGRHP